MGERRHVFWLGFVTDERRQLLDARDEFGAGLQFGQLPTGLYGRVTELKLFVILAGRQHLASGTNGARIVSGQVIEQMYQKPW